jgi:hypothetical protein
MHQWVKELHLKLVHEALLAIGSITVRALHVAYEGVDTQFAKKTSGNQATNNQAKSNRQEKRKAKKAAKEAAKAGMEYSRTSAFTGWQSRSGGFTAGGRVSLRPSSGHFNGMVRPSVTSGMTGLSFGSNNSLLRADAASDGAASSVTGSFFSEDWTSMPSKLSDACITGHSIGHSPRHNSPQLASADARSPSDFQDLLLYFKPSSGFTGRKTPGASKKRKKAEQQQQEHPEGLAQVIEESEEETGGSV